MATRTSTRTKAATTQQTAPETDQGKTLEQIRQEVNAVQRAAATPVTPAATREAATKPATASTKSTPTRTPKAAPVRSNSQARATVGKPATAKRGVAKPAPTPATATPRKGTTATTGVKATRNGKAAQPAPAPEPEPAKKQASRKADAKRALARIVVQAIADALTAIEDENLLEDGLSSDAALVREELGVGADMERIAVQWIHHLPTGTFETKNGPERWWPAGLATPDRSDWR